MWFRSEGIPTLSQGRVSGDKAWSRSRTYGSGAQKPDRNMLEEINRIPADSLDDCLFALADDPDDVSLGGYIERDSMLVIGRNYSRCCSLDLGPRRATAFCERVLET
jgi:hypothetical protein